MCPYPARTEKLKILKELSNEKGTFGDPDFLMFSSGAALSWGVALEVGRASLSSPDRKVEDF